MESNDIEQWLTSARAAGISDAQIIEQLKASGWTDEHIAQLLGWPKPPSGLSPIVPIQPKSGSNWFARHLAVVIGVGAGVLLLGGTAFAALRGYIPVPFLNKGNIQEQLEKAIDVLSGMKSGEIGLAVNVQVEPHDGVAKRLPEPKAGEVSPAQARAQDSQLASDAGQLRTGLALYYDANNAYPNSLQELIGVKKYISRLPVEITGHPITYTVSEDHQDYTLTYKCVSDATKKGEINYKNGTATTCSSGDNSSSTSVLEAFDSTMLFQYLPSDMQISGSITTFVGEQEVNGKKAPKGYVALKGTYASGGTTIAVDGEVRMQDAKYYAIVRQFPSLFFIDLTSLKDKWILIDPTAGDTTSDIFPLDSIADSAPKNDDLGKAKTETATFIRKALDTKAVVLTREGSENINGRRLSKIKITMDADKLPAAVTAYKEDATKRNALVKEVGESLDELVLPKNLESLRVIAGQTTLRVWLENLNGTPHKLELTTILIAPEKVEKLKGKQVRASIALTFEHLGEQPKVDVPANPISWDEAERLISGITEEQQKFEKQRSAIDDIRSALRSYNAMQGAYPDTLAKLLEKPETKTADNVKASLVIEDVGQPLDYTPPLDADAPNYFGTYNKRSSIPNDVFTGKPFVYAKKDTGYTLSYEMVLPKESDEDSFGGSSYYASMYVTGKNTADENVVSREDNATNDVDYDGLTGAEEVEHGTNPIKADTDADGANDKIEIQSKTDPLDSTSKPKTLSKSPYTPSTNYSTTQEPTGKDIVTKQYTEPLAGSTGTIHFWVRSENWKASSYMHMVNFYDSTGSERLLIRYANDGREWLSFILYPAGTSFVGWTTAYNLWQPNTWTHVATTWKVGEVPKTYINGKYLDTYITATQQNQIMTQQMASAISTAGTLYLNGRKISDGGNTDVQKFVVENKVLSAEELTEIVKDSPAA